MDFDKVLQIIIKEFDREHIRYAMMGGFAMGALGILRATMDLDFLIDYQHLPKVERIMKKYNYKCVFKTENVSQYVSDIKIFGEIDFLHAFREISLSMLKRSKELPVFEGKCKIKILSPEDIIGLKLQALVNNKSRETREYADIEAIMEHFKGTLDWNLIEDYFSLFRKKSRYDELKRKYYNVK
jgi:hypothetical protein